MSNKYEGPAIPMSGSTPGMSLRDWFAGQSLAGMLAGAPSIRTDLAGAFAKTSYLIADAMLAERESHDERR